MTITTSVPTYVQIPGNNTATVFAFPFMVFQATDVVVGFITSSGYSLQSSGFSVTGVGNNSGGNVVFAIPPTSQTTVDIRSLTAQVQTTNFANLGAYLPENSTTTMDRITRMVQDLYRLAYQFGFHAPDQESIPWTALPGPAGRANTLAGFDQNGMPTVAVPLQTFLTQPNFDALLTNTSEAAADSSLGTSSSYKQTAAEFSAGVTPANYAYAPGDVRRYGADASGNVDSAAAFNHAHSIVGMNVTYPQGTFIIGSNLNPPRCASIQGAGGYLFGGTLLKPQAGITKLFSITSTGGNYPEYIGRFAIDGTLAVNATGMVLGDNSGAVHLDVANLYIGNFTGTSGFGLVIADTLQTWIRHVYVFGCGTNIQMSGDMGFPTTTKLTMCQVDSATAGQGMAILSGFDIILDDMVFESSFAEGLKIIPAAGGVCRNIVLNRPWFEKNNAAYHLVVDGSAAGATAFVRLNEPYFNTSNLTALAANITGSGADVLFRAPVFTSSLANNVVFQSGAFGRIDQWDNFWSYDSNVALATGGSVMGWEGPLTSYNPTITGVGSGGSISSVSISQARWRRVAVNMLFIEISFTGTVAGTPNYLNVTIPSGFTLKNAFVKYAAVITSNSIEQGGTCLTDGAQGLRFALFNGVLYTAGNGGGIVQGLFEIVG